MEALREEGRADARKDSRKAIAVLGVMLSLACLFGICMLFLVPNKTARITELQDEKIMTLAGIERLEELARSYTKLLRSGRFVPMELREHELKSAYPEVRLENLRQSFGLLYRDAQAVVDRLCFYKTFIDARGGVAHECPKHPYTGSSWSIENTPGTSSTTEQLVPDDHDCAAFAP